MKVVTRKQVAKYAGVSESTVSYVINNGPRQISEATRKKVEEAIKVLGYHPNAVAQSLRRQQTTIVGLIVPDTANPFYGEIARVIENACDRFGYSVMVCNSGGSQARFQRYLEQLILNRVAGIMYIPDGHYDTTTEGLQQLSSNKIPAVVLDYETDLLPHITADQVRMGYLATRHLIELGHRRIGYVARNVPNPLRMNRYTGYQNALIEAGIPVEEHLVVAVGEHPEDGVLAGQQLLDREIPPTAIFAHNDMNAIGVMRAAQERGLRVPDDLSVVGCDNTSFGAYFNPPLTTVAYNLGTLGNQAVGRLIATIEQRTLNGNHGNLKPELIIRGSTAQHPV